jgi:PAS domain S-box-containing protein
LPLRDALGLAAKGIVVKKNDVVVGPRLFFPMAELTKTGTDEAKAETASSARGVIPDDVRQPVVTIGLGIAAVGGALVLTLSALANPNFEPLHPVMLLFFGMQLGVSVAALRRSGSLVLRATVLVTYSTLFGAIVISYVGPTVAPTFLMLTSILLAGLLFGRRAMAVMVAVQVGILVVTAYFWLKGVLPPSNTQELPKPNSVVFWVLWGVSFAFGGATICTLIFFLLKKLGSHHHEERRILQHLAREQQLRAQAELSRLQSEMHRHSAESEFGVLWSATPLGLSVVKERKFVRVNQRMAEIFGYSEADFLGQSSEFLYRDRAEFVRVGHELISGLGGRGFVTVETEGKRKDGTALFFLLTATPLVRERLEDGYVVTCMDISHVKRIEQARVDLERAKREAEAASRAKSAFLANMSHEIRTPLNAILGFTQLLMRDAEVPRSQREQLRIIDRNGEHLLHLINDILEISKIEANRTPIHLSAVDVREVCRDLEGTFQLKASAKQIGWRVECGVDLPRWVQTDSSKLRMVLINLVGNAIKFTDTGEVVLTVSQVSGERVNKSGRLLRFDVCDTGTGIAPEDVPVLFQTFMQTEAGRKAGGTGLGLAISRHYARLLGGDISVQSELGRGSLFRLEMEVEPVASQEPEEVSAASALPQGGVAGPSKNGEEQPGSLPKKAGLEGEAPWAPEATWAAEVRRACAEADITGLSRLLASGVAPSHERVEKMRAAAREFDYLQVEQCL